MEDLETRPARGRRSSAGRVRRMAAAGTGVAVAAIVAAAPSALARTGPAPVRSTVTSTVQSVTSAVSSLLAGTEATFDGGVGTWVGANAVLAPVSSPTEAGSGALAVTTPAAGAAYVLSGNAAGTWTPAVPGYSYTASAWVRAATTAAPTEVALQFANSSYSVLAGTWGQLDDDSTTGWQQTSPAVGLAPAGAAYVRLIVVIGAGVGQTHYLDTASLTATPAGSANVAGPLHTAGNQIYDTHNHPVTLRGTVSDWLDWNTSITPGSPLGTASVTAMKAWGDNVVRVLLSESSWDSADCAYSPGYAAAVDQAVQAITARGMVAMLDLHNNGRTPCEASNQQRMADYPGSVTFWSQVAARYRSNPLVAFDLYNEPHDIPWSVWLDGGSLTDGDGVTWQAAGMQQLYDAVRATGAKNLVIVSGNSWAGNPPAMTDLVKGNNIVYAAHAYTCPTTVPASCSTPDPTAVPASLTAWSALAATQPVMVTEFGWPDSGGSTYNANVIAWAEANHVGWTTYAWFTGGAYEGSTVNFGIVQDSVNFEPDASGMPVLAGLSRNH